MTKFNFEKYFVNLMWQHFNDTPADLQNKIAWIQVLYHSMSFVPKGNLYNYGTPNTSEVTSSFVDNQKFVLTIRNLC